ncbi:MAG: dUTP diphosphatase [Clostridia bacterium]|nr:dUTP diphosphatase [Clostridia bacterium]
MELVIKFKKEDSSAMLPSYAHPEDAGMDIFSNEEKIIPAKTWALVKTGFSMELPSNYEAQVRSKSGLTLKSGLIVLNSPGTIDENYRGEVGVILMNVSDVDYKVEKYQKIAQMVINKVEHFKTVEVTDMSQTNRGSGGFGSTGINK